LFQVGIRVSSALSRKKPAERQYVDARKNASLALTWCPPARQSLAMPSTRRAVSAHASYHPVRSPSSIFEIVAKHSPVAEPPLSADPRAKAS